MKTFGVFLLTLIILPSWCFALGQDQLYTGDTSTVPAGQVQLQLYYNTPADRTTRLAGTNIRFGVSDRVDVKLGYGYLWNTRGSNMHVGPNVGAKWRFLGDGRRELSMSVTGLYVFNRWKGETARENDFGSLVALQIPLHGFVLLVNYGYVWAGGPLSDLGYTAAALAKPVSPRVLVAVQYIDIEQFGSAPPDFHDTIYALAGIYTVRNKYSFAVQFGYRPESVLVSRRGFTLSYSMFL